MHSKLEAFISKVTPSNPDEGVALHSQEVIRALNLAHDNAQICSMLENGYELTGASRVYFSGKLNWIDIALALHRPSYDNRTVIVTYDAHANVLVSISFPQEHVNQSTGDLPFALAVESHALNVVASKSVMFRLETRRESFIRAMMAALVPVLAKISPAAAGTTHTTTTTSAVNSTNWKTRSTSGITTPNDHDTRADTSTDNSTDYQMEFVPSYD